MKIYANRNIKNTINFIYSLVGKDLWVKCKEPHSDYYTYFMPTAALDLPNNTIMAEGHYVREYDYEEYTLWCTNGWDLVDITEEEVLHMITTNSDYIIVSVDNNNDNLTIVEKELYTTAELMDMIMEDNSI